jgi:hypothetical protein
MMPKKKPPGKRGASRTRLNYAFLHGKGQELLGLQSAGLQSAGLQLCCVVHCFAFFFFDLLSLAKAPVANEHTTASINIFFINFYLIIDKMCFYANREKPLGGFHTSIVKEEISPVVNRL